MKRKRTMVWQRLGMWGIALLLVAMAANVPGFSAAQNLARNPSFELDENQDGMPDDWHPFKLCTPYRTSKCKYDRLISYHGEYSAKITQGHIYAANTGTGGWIQEGIVKKGGGRTFRVSVYVRAGKPAPSVWDQYIKKIFPTQVRLYLFGYDPKRGDDFEGAASPIFEIGPEWQKISHTNTFRRYITQVNLILAREAMVGGGDVWFDQVEVVAVKK